MRLNVRLSSKVTVQVDADPSTTVQALIGRVVRENALPGAPELASLQAGAVVLERGSTLSACAAVSDGCTLLYLNPTAMLSPEQQSRMAHIQQNRGAVEQSMAEVYENYPQLLVNNTHSICLRMTLNGAADTCIVDTGAEFNTLSLATARRCGIDSLVDYGVAGRAVGVGASKIVGKLHLVEVRFGSKVLPMNFVVLEDECPTLLGMSCLRMYRAVVDLSNMTVVLDGERVDILGDADVEAYLAAMLQARPGAGN